MASLVCGIKETLEEILVVLDSTQVAIYIDANSSKNLPGLKKYLASAVLPIAGIYNAMGKTSEEQSVTEKKSIEDQCYELLQTIINHICYIRYMPKNENCLIIIDRVIHKVLTKLKLYLEISEVFGFFKDEDFIL